MIKRIIEISNPAHLHCRNQQLIIEKDRKEVGSIPIEDIGVLILDHRQITHTQSVLTTCCENNTAVVISNEKHLPSSIVLPMTGGALHSRTIAEQILATEPTKKRIWKLIVQEKIKAQSRVLIELKGSDNNLGDLIERVRSGDPDNLEARAAYTYWRLLFGKSFRRDRDKEGINSFLNYGYAIVRAAVARAIVGTGLHPSLGVHHHNQYDSLCLADDMMEPLRPMVDRIVYQIDAKSSDQSKLTPEIKTQLLSVITDYYAMGTKKLPFIPALHHYAGSVKNNLCGSAKKITFPVRTQIKGK